MSQVLEANTKRPLMYKILINQDNNGNRLKHIKYV